MKELLQNLSAQLLYKRLEARLAASEAATREARERASELEEQLEMACHLRKPRRAISFKKPKFGAGDVTACAVYSDAHLAERVDPATVNGLNEHNLRIAEARTGRFFQKILFLTDMMSKKLQIRTFVLGLLGDIISNHLHEENMEANLLSPTEEVLFGYDLLRAGINLLLKEGSFEHIDVVCTSGNHGRDVKKPRSSTRVKHSYEWLLYKFLEREFSRNSRISFIIEKGYHIYHDVAGWPVRWHHGDKIKYAGGVGGLYIPVNKAINQWNKACKVGLDVIGHWHQSIDGGNFICNGSLVGWSPFAIDIKASFEVPQQQFFLMDRVRGKIGTMPIFVQE